MEKIETHPQRQTIIDGILAGDAVRTIAAKLEPPVHHSTITRFRMKLLGVASRNLQSNNPTSNAIKELVSDPSGELATQRARTEIESALQRTHQKLAEWCDDAETGNDGKPLHQALAAHTRNNLSTLELRAKLSGLLNDGAQHIQVNIAVAGAGPIDEPHCVMIDALRK